VSWKTPITLLVLLIMLLGAAFYGWRTIISPATDGGNTAGRHHHKAKCQHVQQFERGQVIRAKDIVVNVYNAGSIANLAEDTLGLLERRGFQPGVYDNAPANVRASNVTILTEASLTPEARLVAKQFKGQIQYAKHPAIDPGINVVVGNDFVGVDKTAKRSLRLKRDVSACTSVGSASR
jgi:hypothetical protein